MPDDQKEPQEGQPLKPTEPAKEEQKEEAGQSPKTDFDYEKGYKELQSKFGSQGTELGTLRKDLEGKDQELLKYKKALDFIENDPDLVKAVKAKLEANKDQEPETDDVRDTVSSTVFSDFERDFGIKKLEKTDSEKAKDLRSRIGVEVETMTGRKINEIPLSQLRIVLEKGYKLATADDAEEQARMKGIIEASRNQEAEFGSIPSSGVKGNQKTLTPDEQAVARKLGISDEQYLKNKQ